MAIKCKNNSKKVIVKKEIEKIILTGEEAISILCDLEYVLISLGNIGRYYHCNAVGQHARADYCEETTRFIDERRITHKLAEMRAILAGKFETAVGEDDMDDLERAVENIRVWEAPGD